MIVFVDICGVSIYSHWQFHVRRSAKCCFVYSLSVYPPTQHRWRSRFKEKTSISDELSNFKLGHCPLNGHFLTGCEYSLCAYISNQRFFLRCGPILWIL